jgi:IclR family transcriptional regulator, pca regulon regulatory protein
VTGAVPSPESDRQPNRNGDFVRALDRGLAVIRAFGQDQERLTLSEVARSTGLTRSAARRFLLTLVELGYVRSNGREFSLRPRVLELGYAFLSGMSFLEVAQPHVEEMVTALQESATVGVLDGDEVVCVLRVPARRIMIVAIAVGTRLPAYATSMGRVLLAGLEPEEFERYLDRLRLEPLTSHTVSDVDELRTVIVQTRERGYALVDQELEEGLRSVGVPIRDPSGRVIAGLAVPAHASVQSMDDLRAVLLPRLRATAEQMEADLRAQGTGRPAPGPE